MDVDRVYNKDMLMGNMLIVNRENVISKNKGICE